MSQNQDSTIQDINRKNNTESIVRDNETDNVIQLSDFRNKKNKTSDHEASKEISNIKKFEKTNVTSINSSVINDSPDNVSDINKNRKTALPPALEKVTDQPERTEKTPTTQSGQPLFLLQFRDRIHARTTPTGYQATLLAHHYNDNMNMDFTFQHRNDNPKLPIIDARIEDIPTPENRIGRAHEILQSWTVAHAYSCIETNGGNSTYQLRFARAGKSPLPSPFLEYVWIVNCHIHGNAWVLGTPRDLENARKEIASNNMITVCDEVRDAGNSLESFSLTSESVEHFKFQLTKKNWWVHYEDLWCECHS